VVVLSSHIGAVSLDPPLPVYLFNVVANLKDKSAKGYPIKKVRYTKKNDETSPQFFCLATSCLVEDDFDLLWRRSRNWSSQEGRSGTS
jgi:hypothetical protein